MNDTTNSVTDALSYLAASKSAILSGEPWTPTMQEMYLAAADSLDTLRAENERLRACFDRGADKWETFARAAGWVPPKRQDDAPLDFDGDFEEDLWDERDE